MENMNYSNVPNKKIAVNGVHFAYRTYGADTAVPVVFLNHWGAVLDNFDPRIVDAIAKKHRVITVDYRGMGGSSGSAPLTISEMASDVIALVQELGYKKISLFGFSLGGMVAQDVALKAPELVEKLILTGTGPAGGEGIKNVGKVSWPLIFKAVASLHEPQYRLFFANNDVGRKAANEFLSRLKERRQNRDKATTPRAFLRQLKAVHNWGKQAPQDLGKIKIPVFIANGNNDLMIPTPNSHDMASRIPSAQITIYKDAGHGGIFQYHEDFTKKLCHF